MIKSANIPLPIHSDSRVPLIDDYLLDQQTLTAVERFSRLHENGGVAQEKYYRDLIPLTTPKPGEQYAFEVDLDACTGCKACVAACHNLNGLDEGETWRDVGLLIGGTPEEPIHQHVTGACHHCVEPACLEGCPVNAYEKDPVTGIVRHLDDQCIGCQYCILKCPYDVPKYNKKKGIVRKCDMCGDRLAVGEAPACVQACPNEAIRIKVVNKAEVLAATERGVFLPGAPPPDYTRPTTAYRKTRDLPHDMIPGDYYSVKPEHAHMPLVVMLVLTQLSVGGFLVGRLVEMMAGSGFEVVRPIQSLAAAALGMLALSAATLHLGRPLYAFRALIGLRTSWMSREILGFGVFAKLAVAYAAIAWFKPGLGGGKVLDGLGWGVILSGLFSVFCSAMIYHDTRRVLWRLDRTAIRFGLTTLLLGCTTTLLAGLIAAGYSEGYSVAGFITGWARPLCGAVAAVGGAKLVYEATVLRHLGRSQPTPLKRTAMLMTGVLHQATAARFVVGFVGAVMLPLMLSSISSDASTAFTCIAVVMCFALTLLGEMLERLLFFTTVTAPKMPGGVR